MSLNALFKYPYYTQEYRQQKERLKMLYAQLCSDILDTATLHGGDPISILQKKNKIHAAKFNG